MLVLSLLAMKSFSLTQVCQFPSALEFGSAGAIRDGGIPVFSGLLFSSISPETPGAALASSGDSSLAQSHSGARHSLP